MTRGESIRVLVDYDLFGLNLRDKIGVYLKTDQKTGKHLTHFFENAEWAELSDEWIERVNPDHVPALNESFVSEIIPMRLSYL